MVIDQGTNMYPFSRVKKTDGNELKQVGHELIEAIKDPKCRYLPADQFCGRALPFSRNLPAAFSSYFVI
jgi:hypothetical protein